MARLGVRPRVVPGFTGDAQRGAGRSRKKDGLRREQTYEIAVKWWKRWLSES